MDTSRFSKIKTLHDIKLEKAKLRYELLVAENRLMENFQAIEDMATFSSVFSRIAYGFEIAQNVYARVMDISDRFSSWRRKRKKKKRKDDDYDESDMD